MTAAEKPANRPSLGWLWALILCVVASVVLVAHSLRFDFVTDDAFISFVYAKNLVEHGALVFNLDERVEGYTNFLWTLLLAAGLALRIPPELSSRVLGTLCGVLGLWACARLVRLFAADPATTTTRPGSVAEALPALLLAGIPGYACWSSGGLETMLFTLLTTLGAATYLGLGSSPDQAPEKADLAGQKLWLPALCLGLAALTRPEGFLFFGLLGLHRLGCKLKARALRPTRPELQAAGLFLLLTVPHLLWRRSYYGYWVPNTFFIKSSGGAGAMQQGLYYLLAFARDLKLYVLPLLYGAGLLRSLPAPLHRRYLLWGSVTYLWTAVFLLYVAKVGGDFMGLYRFVMPVVPLNVVCGVLGLYRLCGLWQTLPAEPPRRAAWSKLATALTSLLLLFFHAENTRRVDHHALTFLGADRGIDTPGYLRYYTADRAAIGKWLGQNVRPDDYQVVGGAGAQVYYAGIRALDSFGLSDAYVAHRVPASSSRPGHQKFAPLEYVLSRQPTILTYNVYRIDAAPYRPSPAEAAMWRARGFHYISVQIPGLSLPWYSFLKRIDRALGPFPPEDAGGADSGLLLR